MTSDWDQRVDLGRTPPPAAFDAYRAAQRRLYEQRLTRQPPRTPPEVKLVTEDATLPKPAVAAKRKRFARIERRKKRNQHMRREHRERGYKNWQ